jgi:hypothetical protein
MVGFVISTICMIGFGASPAMAGETHGTNVTLRLSGALVASGRVNAPDGTNACKAQREVLIQKRGGGGGWQTVGHTRSHPNGSYRVVLPNEGGIYRTFVKKHQLGGGQGTCRSATSGTATPPTPPSPPPTDNCTSGYSPCLVYHGGADYDCAGGSGNGPYYTVPGVTYRVTGSDPYGLDADNDGYGCE